MRKVLLVLLGLILGFTAIKAGWLWLAVFACGTIFLYGFTLPKVSTITRSFTTFLAAFAWVGMFVAWGVWGFLQMIEAGKIPGITAGRWFDFLVSNELLKVFWAAVIGVSVPTILAAVILIPYAYQVARNRYGEYEQFKGNERLATRTALASIIGISQGTWMVRAGTSEVLDNPSGSLARFGGPGVLVVQHGNATILERGGRISRVVGSGITWLEAFERVSMVVPLQTRMERVLVPHVTTKDKVMLDEFECWVFHKVSPGPEEGQVQDGEYVYNENILRKSIWSPSGGDWREAVKGITDRAVRDLAGRYDLEDLVPMSDKFREVFRETLRLQINALTENLLGVRILNVDVGEISIPKEVQNRLLEMRLAEWGVAIAKSAKEEAVLKAEADAESLRAMENARASAQNRMIRAIREAFEKEDGTDGAASSLIVTLRYIEALEKMADDPSARVLFPYGMPWPGLEQAATVLPGWPTSQDGKNGGSSPG